MFKLVVYIPEKHLESVKKTLFDAGAGMQGNYDQCCWQVLGTGQYRPLKDSNPYIGQVNELEKVPEWRVEMLVSDENIETVKTALLDAHPYEEPAFDFIKTYD